MKIRVGYVVLWAFCVIGNSVIGMDHCGVVGMDSCGWPMRDVSKTFLALVTARTLDRDAFLNRADQYCGINERTLGSGFTPLHILVSRPDATVELVDALIKKGAVLEGCSFAQRCPDGSFLQGKTPYEVAQRHWLVSPSSERYKPENYSNKAVLNYLFASMLCTKLNLLVQASGSLRYRSIATLSATLTELSSDEEGLEISSLERKRLQEARVVTDLNI